MSNPQPDNAELLDRLIKETGHVFNPVLIVAAIHKLDEASAEDIVGFFLENPGELHLRNEASLTQQLGRLRKTFGLIEHSKDSSKYRLTPKGESLYLEAKETVIQPLLRTFG